MKGGDFVAAWGGIAGVQSTLAVLLDSGVITSARCHSSASASLAGGRAGAPIQHRRQGLAAPTAWTPIWRWSI